MKIKKKSYLKIGYFGSIFKSRGIDLIIELSKLDRNNKYFLYGGSINQVKKIKYKLTNDNINFFPYVPYSEIKKKINDIDICILPYSSKITVSGNVGDISSYTSPLKIFDYMKLGKLIVSSDLPVLREILKNGHNSILIKKYQDKYEWLKKISLVKKNFNKYQKLRKNAYRYANRYDLSWRVKELLSLKYLSNF